MTVSELKALPYSEYLRSPHWLAVRRMMLGMYPHCALCHSNNRLNVHHNNYKNRGAETHLDLIVLCYSCHGKFHGKNNNSHASKLPANVTPIVKSKVDPDIARVERLFFYYLERQARVTEFTDEYLERHPFFTDVRYLQCINTDIDYKQITPRSWTSSLILDLLVNGVKKANKITMNMHVGYLKKAADSKGVMGIRKTLEVLFNPDFVDAKYLHETNKIELVFNPDKFKSPAVLSASIISSELSFNGEYSLSQYDSLMRIMAMANDIVAQLSFIKEYSQRLIGLAITSTSYYDNGLLLSSKNHPTFKDFFDKYGVKRLANDQRPDGYKIEKPVTFF